MGGNGLQFADAERPRMCFSFASVGPFLDAGKYFRYKDILKGSGGRIAAAAAAAGGTFDTDTDCIVLLSTDGEKDNNAWKWNWNLVGGLLRGTPVVSERYVEACQALGGLPDPKDYLDQRFRRQHQRTSVFGPMLWGYCVAVVLEDPHLERQVKEVCHGAGASLFKVVNGRGHPSWPDLVLTDRLTLHDPKFKQFLSSQVVDHPDVRVLHYSMLARFPMAPPGSKKRKKMMEEFSIDNFRTEPREGLAIRKMTEIRNPESTAKCPGCTHMKRETREISTQTEIDSNQIMATTPPNTKHTNLHRSPIACSPPCQPGQRSGSVEAPPSDISKSGPEQKEVYPIEASKRALKSPREDLNSLDMSNASPKRPRLSKSHVKISYSRSLTRKPSDNKLDGAASQLSNPLELEPRSIQEVPIVKPVLLTLARDSLPPLPLDLGLSNAKDVIPNRPKKIMRRTGPGLRMSEFFKDCIKISHPTGTRTRNNLDLSSGTCKESINDEKQGHQEVSSPARSSKSKDQLLPICYDRESVSKFISGLGLNHASEHDCALFHRKAMDKDWDSEYSIDECQLCFSDPNPCYLNLWFDRNVKQPIGFVQSILKQAIDGINSTFFPTSRYFQALIVKFCLAETMSEFDPATLNTSKCLVRGLFQKMLIYLPPTSTSSRLFYAKSFRNTFSENLSPEDIKFQLWDFFEGLLLSIGSEGRREGLKMTILVHVIIVFHADFSNWWMNQRDQPGDFPLMSLLFSPNLMSLRLKSLSNAMLMNNSISNLLLKERLRESLAMVAMFASYLDLDLGTLELESENSWKTKVAWLIFDHFVTKLESLEEVKTEIFLMEPSWLGGYCGQKVWERR